MTDHDNKQGRSVAGVVTLEVVLRDPGTTIKRFTNTPEPSP
jgi:hypothetical protein